MRGKRTMIMGVMAMMVVTSVVHAPGTFAADTNRAGVTGERIGHGGSTYSSSQPDGALECVVPGAERRKVDVIERIGTGGSTYAFRKTAGCPMAGEGRKKVDVIERIGTGGSISSSSQPMS